MDAAAREALDAVDVRQPARILPMLARGLAAARDARAAVSALVGATPERRPRPSSCSTTRFGSTSRRSLHASGVHVEALATSETVMPGGDVSVSVRAFVPDGTEARGGAPDPRRAAWLDADARSPRRRSSRAAASCRGSCANSRRGRPPSRPRPPTDARLTQPYWLEAAPKGDVFVWRDDAPKHMPVGPPVATGHTTLTIAGTPIDVAVPVQFRIVDPVRGELRRPLAVVPALAVQVTPGLDVVALSAARRPRGR